MAQTFPRFGDILFRGGVLFVCVLGVGGTLFAFGYRDSTYNTEVGVAVLQPVPFSHQHHVSGLGIDCRYCHTSVEKSSTAGMPSTHTCMTCHSQIWQEAPVLKPIRESYRSGKPVEWNRVNRLPEYVYFHHGIHVSKGVSCFSCHSGIERMPLTWKSRSFTMKDCLDCHRTMAPENHRLTSCNTCHR